MKFSNVALSFCKENLKYSVNLHILIFITNENMYKQRRYDRILKLKWRSRLVYHSNNANLCHGILNVTSLDQVPFIIAGSLESANLAILAARRHFKEVVGKKIRILL